MADTFATLKTELAARGYDYLDSTRAGRFINIAYNTVCEEYPFPFIEKEITAQTPPVTISDLREILYVADATSGQELYGTDQREISAYDPGRTNTGTGTQWSLANGVLSVYPTDSSARLTIRYIRVPDELSADTDEPLVPQRYRNLITDYAVYLALKDNDEYDAALSAKQLWDYEMGRMVTHLSGQNLQNPSSIAADTPYYPYSY